MTFWAVKNAVYHDWLSGESAGDWGPKKDRRRFESKDRAVASVKNCRKFGYAAIVVRVTTKPNRQVPVDARTRGL